jgi:hypothetical protein
MPSSRWSSTSILRISLCAVEEPSSTPSGTITAARPPGFSSFKNSAMKRSSVFLVFDDREQVFRRGLVIKRARERRIGQHEAVAVGIAGMLLRQRILVADVRVVDAVQRHVHRADPQHGAVEIEAVEQLLVEIVARFNLVKQFRMVVAQIFAGRDQ